MALFASSLCEPLEELCSLEAALASLRPEAVDRLYQAVTGAPKPLRRFLLEIKRDCFNGAAIAHRRSAPEWAELVQRVGPVADRLADLEERRDGGWRDFEAAYGRELERQRQALVALAGDPQLIRGIALASPGLVANLHRLAAEGAPYGRRERKAAVSLLRYLSRAAVKTSPFSTLTRVGLGAVTSSGAPLELCPGPWRQRSLVRLKGAAVSQFHELLYLAGEAGGRQALLANPTAVEVEAGKFRFLRPMGWRLGPDREARFDREALVSVRLAPPVAAAVRAALQAGPEGAGLRREAADGVSVETLDRLAEIGLLLPRRLFASHSTHPEEELLAALRAANGADAANGASPGLVAACAGLVAGKRQLAEGVDPESPAGAIESALDEGFASLGLQPPRSDKGCAFEDVFLEAGGSPRAGREILHLRNDVLDAVQDDLAPLVRLSSLASTRVDFLATLGAFWRDRWPEHRRLPVLELFNESQHLFHLYAKLRTVPSAATTFNPLGLPELAAVEAVRRAVWKGLPGCLRQSGDETALSRNGLERLLDAVPAAYRPVVGPCAFLQPADRGGQLWVLNRLFEGTGRYMSRYTAAMCPEDRERITSHLAARAVLELGVEKAEVVDLMAVVRNPLNAHAVQTRRVLRMPGESFALAPERNIDPDELVAVLGGDGMPYLTDREGRRILPTHLGAMAAGHLPPLPGFLAAFGLGMLNLALPPTRSRKTDGLESLDRLRLGRVVLRRRQWIVRPSALPAPLFHGSEAEAFAAFQRWRLRHGIPHRVFLLEDVAGLGGALMRKPQYLDLRSPLFFALLRPALGKPDAPALTLEEALPSAEDLPLDAQGRPWVVELQWDSFVAAPELAWDEPATGGEPLAPAAGDAPAGSWRGEPGGAGSHPFSLPLETENRRLMPELQPPPPVVENH